MQENQNPWSKLDTELYNREEIVAFFGITKIAEDNLFKLRDNLKRKRFSTDALDQSIRWLGDVQQLLHMAAYKKYKAAEREETPTQRRAKVEMLVIEVQEHKENISGGPKKYLYGLFKKYLCSFLKN